MFFLLICLFIYLLIYICACLQMLYEAGVRGLVPSDVVISL